MCVGGKNNIMPGVGMFGAAASANPLGISPAAGLFPSMVAPKQSEKINKVVNKYSPVGLGMAAANKSGLFKIG